jgi:hypothetical protein
MYLDGHARDESQGPRVLVESWCHLERNIPIVRPSGSDPHAKKYIRIVNNSSRRRLPHITVVRVLRPTQFCWGRAQACRIPYSGRGNPCGAAPLTKQARWCLQRAMTCTSTVSTGVRALLRNKRIGAFSVGNFTSSACENVLESLLVFTHVRVPFREPDPTVQTSTSVSCVAQQGDVEGENQLSCEDEAHNILISISWSWMALMISNSTSAKGDLETDGYMG